MMVVKGEKVWRSAVLMFRLHGLISSACCGCRLLMHSMCLLASVAWFPSSQHSPDPLQPEHQWIKILEPGPWAIGTVTGPNPPHAHREWKREPPDDGHSERQPVWHRRDWTTEGYRRIAPPQTEHQHRGHTAWSSPADDATTLDNISHEAAAVILMNLIHANPSAAVTWDDVIAGLERLCSTAPSNNDAGTSRPSSRPEPYNTELSGTDNASSSRYAPFGRTTTPSAPTRPTFESLPDV